MMAEEKDQPILETPGSMDNAWMILFDIWTQNQEQAFHDVLDFAKDNEQFRTLCQDKIRWARSIEKVEKEFKDPCIVVYMGKNARAGSTYETDSMPDEKKKHSIKNDIPLLFLHEENGQYITPFTLEDFDEAFYFYLWLVYLMDHQIFQDSVFYFGLMFMDAPSQTVTEEILKSHYWTLANAVGFEALVKKEYVTRDSVFKPNHLSKEAPYCLCLCTNDVWKYEASPVEWRSGTFRTLCLRK